MKTLSAYELNSARLALQSSPDYRVLRRFVPRVSYSDGGDGPPTPSDKMGLFVDCETNGLDPETDEMIQVAIQPFLFDNEPEGAERIIRLLPGYVGYEQPSAPIDKTIAARSHQITDEMVAGQTFDDDKVNAFFRDGNAALVIAHKAEFDRPRFERRFPSSDVALLPWACSLNEVDWRFDYGATANSLGAALAAVGEFSDDSHDALEDCRIGIHVLATATREVRDVADASLDGPFGDGTVEQKTAFNDLLRSARVPTIRIWAIFGFDESAVGRLKARKFRWSDGKDGKTKGWFRDIKPDQVEHERAWILAAIPQAEVRFQKFNAKDRWSNRI